MTSSTPNRGQTAHQFVSSNGVYYPHTCSRRTQIWEAELLRTLSQSGRTATPLKEASTIVFKPFSSFTCSSCYSFHRVLSP